MYPALGAGEEMLQSRAVGHFVRMSDKLEKKGEVQAVK